MLAAACAVSAGCGSGVTDEAARASAKAATCPQAWRAGWQKLARRVDAPVFCPSWMPHPLEGRIGGGWTDVTDVDPDGS